MAKQRRNAALCLGQAIVPCHSLQFIVHLESSAQDQIPGSASQLQFYGHSCQSAHLHFRILSDTVAEPSLLVYLSITIRYIQQNSTVCLQITYVSACCEHYAGKVSYKPCQRLKGRSCKARAAFEQAVEVHCEPYIGSDTMVQDQTGSSVDLTTNDVETESNSEENTITERRHHWK